eukprot:Skav232258  [mRNA]  locus=scaffold273:168810:171640:+ [translate_table: standard]
MMVFIADSNSLCLASNSSFVAFDAPVSSQRSTSSIFFSSRSRSRFRILSASISSNAFLVLRMYTVRDSLAIISPLARSSSSLCASASLSIRSISCCDKRPFSLVIWISPLR